VERIESIIDQYNKITMDKGISHENDKTPDSAQDNN